jgi:hypothetical protein
VVNVNVYSSYPFRPGPVGVDVSPRRPTKVVMMKSRYKQLPVYLAYPVATYWVLGARIGLCVTPLDKLPVKLRASAKEPFSASDASVVR